MMLGLFIDKPILGTSEANPPTGSDERSVAGWCYIGSHNFTPSAWGNISGSVAEPVLNVTNFEMGVCFTITTPNADATASELVCWERPPPRYRSGVDEPWMQDKHLQ